MNCCYNENVKQPVDCATWKDINLNGCIDEIRADLLLENRRQVCIWGQVKDSCNDVVAGAIVSLALLRCDQYGRQTAQLVAQVRTDCNGIYRYNVNACGNEQYRVYVQENGNYCS